MRLSIISDDPGYVGGPVNVKVFFNGVERSHVFTADEDKRLVVVAALDERGRMQATADREEVLKETLHGDVRIDMPEERRAAYLRIQAERAASKRGNR